MMDINGGKRTYTVHNHLRGNRPFSSFRAPAHSSHSSNATEIFKLFKFFMVCTRAWLSHGVSFSFIQKFPSSSAIGIPVKKTPEMVSPPDKA